MDFRALSVLIVEDAKQTAEVIQSVLVTGGARRIRLVASPARALEAMKLDAYDLVIVEQNVGGADAGIGLARAIRQEPSSPTPFVPILMMTGQPDARSVHAGRDAGVNEFLVKPFTVAGLLKRIEAVLTSRRPFVQSESYAGPDRRRSLRPHDGPERRRG